MLFQRSLNSIPVVHETLKDFNNFLEIKFFKVDIKSSNEEVNKVALFEFSISHTS